MTVAFWITLTIYISATITIAGIALGSWLGNNPKEFPSIADWVQQQRNKAARQFRRAPAWPLDLALLIKRVLADSRKETP